jgi:acyl-CoA thioesterase
MSDPQSVAERSAHAMYAQDQASQALGMRILEVRPGYACLSMTVREDMVNGHKLCHGGLIFTLADSAFAFACNTYNSVTVASAASVEFLLPARLGDELTATAEERSRSKRTGVYDVVVRNKQGESVALFRGRSHELGGSIATEP